MNITAILQNTLLTALFVMTASFVSYGQTSPELLHFGSEVRGQAVAFNWSVSAPHPVQSFDLERAGADLQFETVGTVSAEKSQRAEATYRFSDENPLPGVAFYRLKVVNQAGDIAYYKVVSHRMPATVEVGR